MALIQLSNTWTNIATLLSNTILTVISCNLQYFAVLLPFSPSIPTSSAVLLFVLGQVPQRAITSYAFFGCKKTHGFRFWTLVEASTNFAKSPDEAFFSLCLLVFSSRPRLQEHRHQGNLLHLMFASQNKLAHVFGKWMQAKALRWIQVNGRRCIRATLAFVWCIPMPERLSGCTRFGK